VYRNLYVGVLLFVFLAGQSLITLAQGPTVTKPALSKSTQEPAATDVRPILEKMRKENKLVEGKNRIHVKKTEGYGDLSLWAIIRMGKVVGWEVTDIHGNKLPTTMHKEKKVSAQDTKPTVKCQVCVYVKRTGKDGTLETDVICWEIDCKDLPPPST